MSTATYGRSMKYTEAKFLESESPPGFAVSFFHSLFYEMRILSICAVKNFKPQMNGRLCMFPWDPFREPHQAGSETGSHTTSGLDISVLPRSTK